MRTRARPSRSAESRGTIGARPARQLRACGRPAVERLAPGAELGGEAVQVLKLLADTLTDAAIIRLSELRPPAAGCLTARGPTPQRCVARRTRVRRAPSIATI